MTITFQISLNQFSLGNFQLRLSQLYVFPITHGQYLLPPRSVYNIRALWRTLLEGNARGLMPLLHDAQPVATGMATGATRGHPLLLNRHTPHPSGVAALRTAQSCGSTHQLHVPAGTSGQPLQKTVFHYTTIIES